MAMIVVKVPVEKYNIEMWYWCARTLGKPGIIWDYSGLDKNFANPSFEFSTKELATTFILTWL